MAFRREAVKELRKRLKLTMRDAATLIGVTASAWCRWEDMSITPSAEYVGKMVELSEKCGLRIEFFSKGKQSSFDKVSEYLKNTKPAPVASPEIDDVQMIVNKFQRVKDLGKGVVLDGDPWFDQPWFKDLEKYVSKLGIMKTQTDSDEEDLIREQ